MIIKLSCYNKQQSYNFYRYFNVTTKFKLNVNFNLFMPFFLNTNLKLCSLGVKILLYRVFINTKFFFTSGCISY